MKQRYYDIVIIGGGPVGMAAAVAAKKAGIDRVVVLEQQVFWEESCLSVYTMDLDFIYSDKI